MEKSRTYKVYTRDPLKSQHFKLYYQWVVDDIDVEPIRSWDELARDALHRNMPGSFWLPGTEIIVATDNECMLLKARVDLEYR